MGKGIEIVEMETSPPVPDESAESSSLLGGGSDAEAGKSPLLGAEAGEPEPEAGKEDLSKIPFFKRLGKKQFWGDIGKAIKKGTENGVKSASAGIKSLGKKETWVGEKGAFGKETWAGETGLFGSNNRAKVKGLVDKVGAKLKKKSSTDDDGADEAAEDEGTRKEKERIALTMLKEGQISQ